MRQSIPEWTEKKFWKTVLNGLKSVWRSEVIWSVYGQRQVISGSQTISQCRIAYLISTFLCQMNCTFYFEETWLISQLSSWCVILERSNVIFSTFLLKISDVSPGCLLTPLHQKVYWMNAWMILSKWVTKVYFNKVL